MQFEPASSVPRALGHRRAAQEFLNAMSVGDDDESKSDVSDDSKKDSKDKAKKSAKGVLVYDEELGRMVVQRPRKRQGDFDGFDE